MSSTGDAAKDLQDVIEALCAPDGCEWDRTQTPESLCEYLLEETFEFMDAIRHGTKADKKEEMGDVFFLLFFLAYLFNQGEGAFSLKDTLKASAAKMVRRHPHVFAGKKFANLDEQLKAWEEIKKEEQQEANKEFKGTFDSLPTALPTLARAYRIHSKAARAGFTWDSDDDALLQAEAEWLELHDALEFGDKDSVGQELGDLIFTLVELGRRKGFKANALLDATNNRFLDRYSFMEKSARDEDKDFAGLSMEEKNVLWKKAKDHLATKAGED